jgi:nucleoside-diphosphate kinase
MIERTFVMIKPDAMARALVGEIITRFEKKGLTMKAAKLLKMDEELASKHYAEHVGKPFYDDLIKFITSGPVLAMVWEGENAIKAVRKLVGKTDPHEAASGTIRGDWGAIKRMNLVHASDSPESAEREIALYFDESEIIDWERACVEYIHD